MHCRGTTNNQPNHLQKQPPVKPMKLLMIGNARSGKTTTLQRYCLGSFKESYYLPSIGIDFRTKRVSVNGNDYKVQIWDTSGQERFRTITRAYYRGSKGVFLFYNVRHRNTFDYVTTVLKELDELWSKQEPLILVGTGSDLSLEDREVTYEEGLALAQSIRSNGVPFFEVSSKTNTNVEDMFHHMYEMVLGLRPCVCLKHVHWQPKLHIQCHDIQKFIFKLILVKNLRSFSGGARMPNDIILYIFNFLGVAKFEVQWYGKAIEESKKNTTNYWQQANNNNNQVNDIKNKTTCVVM